MTIFIGIDGGGTHSTAVALTEEGTLRARSEGGGMNYLTDGIETCSRRLQDMLTKLLLSCPGDSVGGICVGSAALDGPASAEVKGQFYEEISGLKTSFPSEMAEMSEERFEMQSDLFVALMGVTGGEPGLMVVAGTGSMLLLMDRKGGQHVSGGWGSKFGDVLSGYTLARQALELAMDYEDDLGRGAQLHAAALDFFRADNLRSMVERLYTEEYTPAKLAAFAPRVLALMEQGDREALNIVAKNVAAMAERAKKLLDTYPEVKRVALYGGMFQHSRWIRDAFVSLLTDADPDLQVELAETPPEMGAAQYMMSRCR
ncbi:MAG: hypothetical protein HUJ69_06290 [Lachnospiraceae bacterium]|nr:hypothetical protein [Lachnospiraceae bacterium]